MEGFSDGSSTLPASTKKKDMTIGHVFLFWFRRRRRPPPFSISKYLGQMNGPCAKGFACGENACTARHAAGQKEVCSSWERRAAHNQAELTHNKKAVRKDGLLFCSNISGCCHIPKRDMIL